MANNMPAAQSASAPSEAVETLTTHNVYELVLDGERLKQPVFIYCVPNQEVRAKCAACEEKLKHEVNRTAGKCAMRFLDTSAQPELAKRFNIAVADQWPVIIAYIRGAEARRCEGNIRDKVLADWVHSLSWLFTE